ncbi:MAG: helix-turn-helix transcriptional regulator [Clostridium sp.]|uniref:helix-turn-helix transcriptional regulator n=1 Tax=Clostridium sp. TaxID=1506 RepID=UPI003D6C9B21
MKVDRLLAITMLLINKHKVTASELAEYFEVSVRTIHRDMESICKAGIPIISCQGKNGGYSIMENYKVDKNFLKEDEILSLVTALKGINKTYEDKNIGNIIEKVCGLIPKKSIENFNKRRNYFIVDFTPWGESNTQKRKIQELRPALEENKLVSFCYTNLNGVQTERCIEPMSLVLKISSWYLYGYCRYREDYRLFKLSKMKKLTILEQFFKQREKTLTEVPFENGWNNDRIQHIVMKFTQKVRSKVDDYFDEEQMVLTKEGDIIVTVDYPEDEWVYSTVLSFGSEVEVIEPAHIRKIIKERAEKICDIYKS